MTFAMIAATLSIIIIFSIMKIIESGSRQVAYLEVMSDVYSLCETGLSSNAINSLITNPKYCDPATAGSPFEGSGLPPKPHPVTGGEYAMTCAQRDIPVQTSTVTCYYITVIATRTVSGRSYSQRLHSYVEISNVSDYLLAVNTDLPVAPDAVAPLGKIYAKHLVFNPAPIPPRTVQFQRAEFFESLVPPLDSIPSGCTPGVDCTQWSSNEHITLSDPNNPSVTCPVKLPAPLRFPIITASDASTYTQLAGPHTHISNFDTTDPALPGADIYPPGYSTPKPTGPTGDSYAFHSTIDKQHVYYSPENIKIGIPVGSTVTIHGQIIFFTTNSIFINGNIVSALLTDPLPGAGAPASSSTAHQAVLIAGPGQNIFFTASYCNPTLDSTLPLPTPQVLTVEAFLFATSGSLLPAHPICVVGNQSLNFIGSIVVGSIGDMASMFGARKYDYMTTLQSNPPPYTPVFTVTYNEFQEIVGSPSIY